MSVDFKSDHPVVGVFDSGVGGLSVLAAIRRQLPAQPVIYLADQAHVPYGSRSLEEVRTFSKEVTRFLLARGACIIVVACNTASAAALLTLRELFPQTPFVGMEPAVKPAAEQTHSGVVGVLATPATFQGALYASVVERFAKDVRILQNTCPGLVTQIEAGLLEDDVTWHILEGAIQPMLAEGIDTIVLGCTHYPFVIPLIQQIAGNGVRVIDPAPAVARQVLRVLQAHGWAILGRRAVPPKFFTSAEPGAFSKSLRRLLGIHAKVEKATWLGSKLKAIEQDPPG